MLNHLRFIKIKFMFGLFKKKSEKQTLEAAYQKLTKESFELSKTNRKASDQKAYEAEQVMKKLESLANTPS